MNVYSQISNNRIRTFTILFVFIILVFGFFYLIGQYFQSPGAYLIIGLLFSLLSGFGSYFYSDKIILFTLGAKPANKRDHFDFYTVTENLSLATGIPMPKLYVIDDPAPNAFATGRDPKHAVVCATTGLLKILDRSDLEGVISHELAHIKNYDILLASIVSVLVGTIVLISDWLMRSLWWGGGGQRRRTHPILFILLIITLILTPIAATLIQLAISRRREFLADASGVLLTRNPAGLISALEKITNYPYQMHSATTSTAHLFICNPFRKNGEKKTSSLLTSLFSTHPPVEERIRILRNM